MRWTHKLRKLADRRTLRSAKRYVGRVFRPRRLIFRLDVDRIIASIDRAGFAAIHERHAIKDPGSTWPKYLDLKKWMEVNLTRVRRLELDHGRRRQVLDIGSGAGYFLYICKWLGHEALGIDIDEVPMYPEMTRLLGLERVVWRIQAFVPLPDLGRRFDLITAFMICFNNHNQDDLWGVPEWDFFLDDLTNHLRHGGRVWLELNRQRDGTFMTDELRKFFQNWGACIDENQVTFSSAPSRIALSEAAGPRSAR
jgi:SAM-dependent methyltransferase